MDRKKILKKLSKLELLELLAEQEREIQELKQQVEERDRLIEQRTLRAKQFGNIAQAALAVNEVFETAQRAADQYLESVKRSVEDRLHRTGSFLCRYEPVAKSEQENPDPNLPEEQQTLSVDEILRSIYQCEVLNECTGSMNQSEKATNGCAGGMQ